MNILFFDAFNLDVFFTFAKNQRKKIFFSLNKIQKLQNPQ